MSLKKQLISIIVILTTLNIVQCGLLIISQRNSGNQNKQDQFLEQYAQNIDSALDALYEDYIVFDEASLTKMLSDLGIKRNIEDELYVFVPKTPCSACLHREFDVLEDLSTKLAYKINLILPSSLARDTKIKFRGCDNINEIEYDPKQLQEDSFTELDQFIYFAANSMDIHNILITTQVNDLASKKYLINLKI